MNESPDIAENLPDLERRVFVTVRGNGWLSVNAVVALLADEARPLAYTTVMTVLTRLWQKGYLERRAEGRAYLYEARPNPEIATELASRAARETIKKYGARALSGFVHTLSPEQKALVARLLEEDDDGR